MKTDIKLNTEAIRLRKEFGHDVSSPVDIFALISAREDITLVFHPMSGESSGMCIKDDRNKLIALNSKMSLGRQRFTAAHELYHLFFHDMSGSTLCSMNMDFHDLKETEANIFASFFLMPHEALDAYVRDQLNIEEQKLSLDEVIRIEQHFGMSRQAVLWRLVRERYVNAEDTIEMKTNVIKSARALGFGHKLYLPLDPKEQYNTLGGYIKKVEAAYKDGKLSVSKYEELMLDAFRDDIVYGSDEEGEELYD